MWSFLRCLTFKGPEVQKIMRGSFLYYFALSSIALSFFLILGVEVYFTAALFWILGAIATGIFGFTLTSWFRQQMSVSQ